MTKLKPCTCNIRAQTIYMARIYSDQRDMYLRNYVVFCRACKTVAGASFIRKEAVENWNKLMKGQE